MSVFTQKEKEEREEIKRLVNAILPFFKGKSMKISKEVLEHVQYRLDRYSQNSPIVFPDDELG